MPAARVDEIAERLPDGMDRGVGEGGSALSGVERQRVSIAGGEDAPIALLDEATSVLDPYSEEVVVRGAHELTQGKTVVVAHRLATAVDTDQVRFLGNGRIVERGNHSELLAFIASGAGGRR
ncbi:hypothetical protein ACWIGW_39815 [Nocardia brasiliensis]